MRLSKGEVRLDFAFTYTARLRAEFCVSLGQTLRLYVRAPPGQQRVLSPQVLLDHMLA